LKNIIDISVPMHSKMPMWPGSAGFRLTHTRQIRDGNSSNISKIEFDIHVGTHVDAPLHFRENGNPVEQLDLEVMVGPAVVADLMNLRNITADDLEALNLQIGIERLLLRTTNSRLLANGVNEFSEDFVALTADAAQWVVNNGIRLIGIDYLSIQRYSDDSLTHLILLSAGVIIVEGLNLLEVEAGHYELICLPLKIIGAEGAPSRAILRPLKAINNQ